VPEIGTLTLLFTDLVGSTESLVALGEDRYDSVRDEHDELVGGTITAYEGEVVKHTGVESQRGFRRRARHTDRHQRRCEGDHMARTGGLLRNAATR
jgi:class 3 adenylate cyclase